MSRPSELFARLRAAWNDGKRPVVDASGEPVVDDCGQPLYWATLKQRVLALLGALAVIGITLAFAYALSTGSLFFH